MTRLLIGLFALPLLAQTPWLLPPPPAGALVPDPLTIRVMRTPLTVAQSRISLDARQWALSNNQIFLSSRPCAVPLKNMLRFQQPDPPMPKYVPKGPFRLREVPVPAPSCEDKERK